MTNDTMTTWRFTHWFPSKDDSKELKGEFMMHGQLKGSTLILQSDKDATGGYVLVRVTISLNGTVASGSWHEHASADGEFEGMEYSGNGQLIIGEGGDRMTGLWAGAGFDHELDTLRMYTGKWELVRLSDAPA